LSEREREREWWRRGVKRRRRERISSRLPAERGAQSEAQYHDPEIMT